MAILRQSALRASAEKATLPKQRANLRAPDKTWDETL